MSVDAYHLEGREEESADRQPGPQGDGQRGPGRGTAKGAARAEPVGADRTIGPDRAAGSPRCGRRGATHLGPGLGLAPESLRVNPGKLEGLRPIGFNEAVETIPSRRQNRLPQLRPCWRLPIPRIAVLALVAQRRKPQTTLAQLLVARIEDGVVKYQDTLFYNVQYSGVKSLRSGRAQGRRPTAAQHHAGHSRQGNRAGAQGRQPRLRGLEPLRRNELMGSRADRAGLGRRPEHRQAGNRQERGTGHSPAAAQGRRPGLGQIVLSKAETIDLDQAGELTRAAAHRSPARPDARRRHRGRRRRPSSSTAIGPCGCWPRATSWRR